MTALDPLAAAPERPLCGGTNFLARKAAMSVQSQLPYARHSSSAIGLLAIPKQSRS
jgi:hypothetical protein